jgi:ribulose-bisphosphate carboxylase large chain
MPVERIEADYLIESPGDPRVAAEVMAGEQSCGTFVAVPGETPELKARSAARVESLDLLEEVPSPSLPIARQPDGRARRARVTLSWPIANFGPSLSNLMATVAGNLFELRQLSGLKLLDIRLPVAFATANPGPQFGIEGTRRLAGVQGRPLIGTIVKPSVGLDPQQTAELARALADADIDFIKDDELQADGPHCPFAERARAVLQALDLVAQRKGRKAMFAFNITGDLDEMRYRHDLVQSLGGTCVMVSLNSIGLAGLSGLRRHSALPIHAHRNGWGYLSRHPLLGWSYVAWQKFWRLAGVDHMHVNGLRNKFSEDDESVIASAKACLTPMFAPPEKGFEVMPVFSSGQWAGQAGETFAALGTCDVIYACGGGIMAHPDGISAGVTSVREAWDAAMSGVPAETYARSHPALAAALKAFG